MKPKERALDLKRVKKELDRFFKEIDIDNIEYRNEEHRVVAIFDASLKVYDDDIVARFEFYDDGKALFGFTLDHLEYNEQTLRILNNFNEFNPYFLGYIESSNHYLRIVHTVPLLREEDIVQYSLIIINSFASDGMEPLLQPLALLTESD